MYIWIAIGIGYDKYMPYCMNRLFKFKYGPQRVVGICYGVCIGIGYV